jgi:hypothetical protein
VSGMCALSLSEELMKAFEEGYTSGGDFIHV